MSARKYQRRKTRRKRKQLPPDTPVNCTGCGRDMFRDSDLTFERYGVSHNGSQPYKCGACMNSPKPDEWFWKNTTQISGSDMATIWKYVRQSGDSWEQCKRVALVEMLDRCLDDSEDYAERLRADDDDSNNDAGQNRAFLARMVMLINYWNHRFSCAEVHKFLARQPLQNASSGYYMTRRPI